MTTLLLLNSCSNWMLSFLRLRWFSSQGTYGLGIMIIEGKHAEVGQGIFVSDIQEGSAAEQVRTTD